MNHTAATYLTCHYLCHGLSMQKVYQASFEYIKPMHISHCYMSSAVPWEKTMLKDWLGLWQRIWCGNILQSISSSQAACHTVIPSPSFMPHKYLPCKLYTPYILWCEHEYIRNNISFKLLAASQGADGFHSAETRWEKICKNSMVWFGLIFKMVNRDINGIQHLIVTSDLWPIYYIFRVAGYRAYDQCKDSQHKRVPASLVVASSAAIFLSICFSA